jgi:hypothetical protein
MENEKYEQLLEKVIVSTEEQKSISKSLLDVAQGLRENTKYLNDNFILHSQQTIDISKDIKLIKNDLVRYLKVALIILFLILGGASVVKITGIDFFKNLLM